MKTNKFGTHSASEEELFRSRCIYPLDDAVDWLIRRYRPAVVVSFGSWPKEMLSHHTLQNFLDEPDLPTDTDKTFFLHVPRAGWLTPNDEKRNYFRKLGRQWATGEQAVNR
jgi:hypothetical protein